MDRFSEGYKRAIDKIWGPIAIFFWIFGPQSEFWGQDQVGNAKFDQNSQFQNKQLTFVPKYPNFQVKVAFLAKY